MSDPKPNGKPRFDLGQLLSTPAALQAMAASNQTPMDFLSRHARGDWGDDLCDEDRRLNDQALVDGSRILSVYRTRKGVKIWIITEATDDNGHRAATTCILPSEY